MLVETPARSATASGSAAVTSSPPRSGPTSTVNLHDWWLIKPKGRKGIAVGGIANVAKLGKRPQAAREYSSAAIVKRLDNTTVEACNGDVISISGFLDMSRTQTNGFTSEIFTNFTSGFPFNWEDYSAKCGGKKPASDNQMIHSSFNESGEPSDMACSLIPFSLDDLSGAQIRDLVMLRHGNGQQDVFSKHIITDLMGKVNSLLPQTFNIQENIKNAGPVFENFDSHGSAVAESFRMPRELQNLSSPINMGDMDPLFSSSFISTRSSSLNSAGDGGSASYRTPVDCKNNGAERDHENGVCSDGYVLQRTQLHNLLSPSLKLDLDALVSRSTSILTRSSKLKNSATVAGSAFVEAPVKEAGVENNHENGFGVGSNNFLGRSGLDNCRVLQETVVPETFDTHDGTVTLSGRVAKSLLLSRRHQ